ncbi:hypothetical protein B0H10DRAFT_2219827 [Mycena sp. CBHHK59/15]|nr:hypothetical protein B0H10DRAFT_2219827 [Mycena sp. CBHHK59/15]
MSRLDRPGPPWLGRVSQGRRNVRPSLVSALADSFKRLSRPIQAPLVTTRGLQKSSALKSQVVLRRLFLPDHHHFSCFTPMNVSLAHSVSRESRPVSTFLVVQVPRHSVLCYFLLPILSSEECSTELHREQTVTPWLSGRTQPHYSSSCSCRLPPIRKRITNHVPSDQHPAPPALASSTQYTPRTPSRLGADVPLAARLTGWIAHLAVKSVLRSQAVPATASAPPACGLSSSTSSRTAHGATSSSKPSKRNGDAGTARALGSSTTHAPPPPVRVGTGRWHQRGRRNGRHLPDKAVRHLLDGDAAPDRSTEPIWLMGVQLLGWTVEDEARVAVAATHGHGHHLHAHHQAHSNPPIHHRAARLPPWRSREFRSGGWRTYVPPDDTDPVDSTTLKRLLRAARDLDDDFLPKLAPSTSLSPGAEFYTRIRNVFLLFQVLDLLLYLLHEPPGPNSSSLVSKTLLDPNDISLRSLAPICSRLLSWPDVLSAAQENHDVADKQKAVQSRVPTGSPAEAHFLALIRSAWSKQKRQYIDNMEHAAWVLAAIIQDDLVFPTTADALARVLEK